MLKFIVICCINKSQKKPKRLFAVKPKDTFNQFHHLKCKYKSEISSN